MVAPFLPLPLASAAGGTSAFGSGVFSSVGVAFPLPFASLPFAGGAAPSTFASAVGVFSADVPFLPFPLPSAAGGESAFGSGGFSSVEGVSPLPFLPFPLPSAAGASLSTKPAARSREFTCVFPEGASGDSVPPLPFLPLPFPSAAGASPSAFGSGGGELSVPPSRVSGDPFPFLPLPLPFPLPFLPFAFSSLLFSVSPPLIYSARAIRTRHLAVLSKSSMLNGLSSLGANSTASPT
mmetsp:Transcript_106022/g.165499  ORF Transcript_106022/g.165499 Transcript_106022/m.165499 type:complete len:237 (+) Transcript_106022:559-1269(+)